MMPLRMHHQVRCANGDHHADNGRRAAHQHIVLVAGILVDQRLVDVVGPHGGEGAHVAGHAAHESGDQRGDAEAEQARAAGSEPSSAAALRYSCAVPRQGAQPPRFLPTRCIRLPSAFCRTTRPSRPGRITMNGTAILKNDPMIGAMRAERRLLRGKHALNNEEVGRPVAEADHETRGRTQCPSSGCPWGYRQSGPCCATCGCSRRPRLTPFAMLCASLALNPFQPPA